MCDNAIYQCLQEQKISEDALAANIVFDRKVRLGGHAKTQEQLPVSVRLIAIKGTPHIKRSGVGQGGPGQGETLLIATDRFDLAPEVIALMFKHRWSIEIFFRFL